MDGAAQIVTPAFVSLLCICIVFVPMFFLEGVARFLFVPMAEAVMFKNRIIQKKIVNSAKISMRTRAIAQGARRDAVAHARSRRDA